MELQGKTIGIVIADGYHEHEFWYPYYRFKEAGATVLVAAPEKGRVQGEGRHGTDGLLAEAAYRVEELAPDRLTALFLPGGIYGPLRLRDHPPTIRLVQAMAAANKVVAAICHGPWILISAGVVKGKKVTCPGDMAIDATNAGATHLVQPVVVDGNLVTAEYFGVLDQMFQQLMPLLARPSAK